MSTQRKAENSSCSQVLLLLENNTKGACWGEIGGEGVEKVQNGGKDKLVSVEESNFKIAKVLQMCKRGNKYLPKEKDQ